MDRIERALAKARREGAREKGGDPPVSPDPKVEATPDTSAASARGGTPVTTPDGNYDRELIGKVSIAKLGLVALDYSSPSSDLFRILRTQVRNALKKSGKPRLGICSANAGEGKTFIAANVAASVALSQNGGVLLIDFDLRRPGIHRHFGLTPSPGVTDFLKGNMSLRDCIRETPVPGLQVITAGTPIRNSSEALGSSDLHQAFADISREKAGSVIICDLPPLLAGDDAIVFSANLGGIVFIVEEGRTRPGDIKRAFDLLPPGSVIGTVLNKSRYGNSFNYSIHDAA